MSLTHNWAAISRLADANVSVSDSQERTGYCRIGTTFSLCEDFKLSSTVEVKLRREARKHNLAILIDGFDIFAVRYPEPPAHKETIKTRMGCSSSKTWGNVTRRVYNRLFSLGCFHLVERKEVTV